MARSASSRRRRDRHRLEAAAIAARTAGRRSSAKPSCRAGRPGRGGAGGRAARRRRPGVGPGARRSRRRRPQRPVARRAPRCAPGAPAPAPGPLDVQPQGIATTTSGSRPGELAPADLGRLLPRRPGDVHAAGDRIISGTQCPPTKGGSSHSSASTRRRLRRRPRRDPREPPLEPPRSSRPRARRPAASPSRATSSRTSPGAPGPAGDRGPPRQAGGHLEDVLVGDGADVADLLGDDQVGLQGGQTLLVELVERPALADDPLHGRVDLARRRCPPGTTVLVRCGSGAPPAGSRTRG